MTRPLITEKLNKEWLFWDGGTGTMLQSRGLMGGELPETWNLTRRDDILWLNQGYLEAGADIINTNTFGANKLKYPDNLEEIITSSVEIAKEARAKAGREDAYIALDIGPTGKLLKPLGDLEFEDAVNIFGEIAEIGSKAGADLILIETMSDSYELKAAVLGAKENSDLPIFATVTFDASGKLLTGGTVKSVVALLEGLRVDAIGTNCSLGPKELIPIVKEFTEESSLPIIVTPNAGLPKTKNGETYYDIEADEFSDLMVDIARLGVQVLGGCCGTTHNHIKSMVEKVSKVGFVPISPKNNTYVTSFSQAVKIGNKPVIIGERINPTGKKRLKEALREEDYGYILEEGIKQEDSGANILDVNVGLPEIDEAEVMEKVVARLQGITALPLQIDAANPDVLERGLRIYNGKPMVNSVNGKEESMAAVFPLVAKYGGVVVALTLDEDGIPDTAEGRVEIAKKIYKEAEKYGIDKKDIIIDALTLTISSGSDMGKVTLETLKRVRDELNGNTILGVSNVSFGLPYRELVNSTFFSMALLNGLSAAIINPGNEAMMNAFNASMALLGYDKNCEHYVETYGDYIPPARGGNPSGNPGGSNVESSSEKNAEKKSDEISSLAESIERGLSEKAKEAAIEGLKTRAALDLINEELIPALDKVGKGFEAGAIFLPQLLMSAEAAKAAFGVVKDSMEESSGGDKGKVIVATVKGDIHDIGKNIAKVLLENYGFQVLDLGKDVSPNDIVDAAVNHDAKLVGLSALMTTTVSSMEETIRLLKEKSPGTKILVGGAVLTEDYANTIGADHYAKDAMATVRYADLIVGDNDENK